MDSEDSNLETSSPETGGSPESGRARTESPEGPLEKFSKALWGGEVHRVPIPVSAATAYEKRYAEPELKHKVVNGPQPYHFIKEVTEATTTIPLEVFKRLQQFTLATQGKAPGSSAEATLWTDAQ